MPADTISSSGVMSSSGRKFEKKHCCWGRTVLNGPGCAKSTFVADSSRRSCQRRALISLSQNRRPWPHLPSHLRKRRLRRRQSKRPCPPHGVGRPWDTVGWVRTLMPTKAA
jgi:hypothetical protein